MMTEKNKILKNILLFMKWSLSSQIASVSDMGVTQVLCYLIGLNKPVSKIIGQICGAIVNCSVNYKWTFKENDKNLAGLKAVALKYFLVWMGSLTLNTFGFTIVSESLENSSISDSLGLSAGTCGFISQLFVSLIVSIFWNFILQRYFVYKDLPIKSIFNKLILKIKRNGN